MKNRNRHRRNPRSAALPPRPNIAATAAAFYIRSSCKQLTPDRDLRRIVSMKRAPTGDGDAASEVLVALRRIIRATDIRSREIAKQTGLTTAQLIVLGAIARLGEVTTRIISLDVSLSPATVTTIMDRLSERGFVERYRSEHDRRVVYTRLTAKGRQTLAAAPVLLQQQFAERFRRLEQHDQMQIVSTLSQIAEMMDAADLDAAPMLLGEDAADLLPARARGTP